MRRPFQESDNGKRFHYRGAYGNLEYPLTDLGSANSNEGALWFDKPFKGYEWLYVSPVDVDPEGWVAEGTPTERHTPGQPVLTPLD